ncbi:MAG: NAD(P)/FAD-dependent oxidoreductase [Bacteroidetes bacterium]|nr:NAD(P)/FAD-dependent oxidoreductase [Bacteroidota bacterium]MBS1757949.1 NAD(P)/FAD-dependent oxidoreductase [Bacteroidota bacterium]
MQNDTIIIGASIAGLACAACLQKNNCNYIIIEKQDTIVAPWHKHYERLHLHTHKKLSNLPYKKFDTSVPAYPSRLQVIQYLENYKNQWDIKPIFNSEAIKIFKQKDEWITKTNRGDLQSTNIIMATGAFGKPLMATYPGQDTFTGKIIHSYEYKSGRDFMGQKVLLVGFGNSACEIAIDLFEQGAIPVMSVRSAVNVVPRDLCGIPIQQLSVLLNVLPARIADTVSKPLINLSIGNIEKWGLKKMKYGPIEQIHKDAKAPVIDIGIMKLIKNGKVQIREGIEYLEKNTVHFTNKISESFDAIIMATGYYRDDANIVEADSRRFEDLSNPIGKQQYFGKDGLYFCGYRVSPTGQIREIAMNAKKIAKHIAAKS